MRSRIHAVLLSTAILGAVLTACAAPVPQAGQVVTLADFTPSPPATPLTASATPVEAAAEVAAVAPTDAPPPTATPMPVIEPPPAPVGPDSYPEGVNPLTGLAVSDPALLLRRPLLIKISNAPPVVRPQASTSLADIIFEHYAEGGWTRFSAIFYGSDADYIGSVRSGRLIDLQLAPAYDALFVFSGASNGVIDTIRESPLYPYNAISPQFGYGEPYFVRMPRPDLDFEHTLFTNTAILRQWAAERNVRQLPAFSTPGMLFDARVPAGGTPASRLQIDYVQTSVTWQYDPISGLYVRWTDGIPHTDATTGEQLAFENVIVISAYHEYRDLYPEKYFGVEKSWYVELQGGGPATILRDGLAFEGRWVREQEGDLITFYDAAGSPMALKPGQTFVQVISSTEGAYTRRGPEEVIVLP